MKASFTAALLSAIACAGRYKIGVFSDIHLQPNYLPDRPASQYCVKSTSNDKIAAEDAYFGRLHCDPPHKLVETAFQKMNADHDQIDFILVPGDLIGHSISLDLSEVSEMTELEQEKRYMQLLQTHRSIASLFEEYFPDTPVLPTFGNNDAKYHY